MRTWNYWRWLAALWLWTGLSVALNHLMELHCQPVAAFIVLSLMILVRTIVSECVASRDVIVKVKDDY